MKNLFVLSIAILAVSTQTTFAAERACSNFSGNYKVTELLSGSYQSVGETLAFQQTGCNEFVTEAFGIKTDYICDGQKHKLVGDSEVLAYVCKLHSEQFQVKIIYIGSFSAEMAMTLLKNGKIFYRDININHGLIYHEQASIFEPQN